MMEAESIPNMYSNLAVTNKRNCQSCILSVPYIILTHDARKLKHKIHTYIHTCTQNCTINWTKRKSDVSLKRRMTMTKCFSQNLINNRAQKHVVTCAVCVLKVPTALQNNLRLVCLQQNGQDRTHRTHVMCTEGRDWKPERTLMTNSSSSLSPLPCKVR
jgi:hypothetical protein